jgi:hypothetical protein
MPHGPAWPHPRRLAADASEEGEKIDMRLGIQRQPAQEMCELPKYRAGEVQGSIAWAELHRRRETRATK